MKKILLPLMLLPLLASAQLSYPELSIGYTHTIPRVGMKNYIRQGNGLLLEAHLADPIKRYSIGAEVNFSIYGNDQSQQEYQFSDGTSAPMNINVSNYFVNVMAVGRYYLTQGTTFQPFVTGKVGYSHWSTELTITDPNEWDDCEPLESDILKKDGAFVATAGAGIRWDMSSVIKSLNRNRFLVDLSTSYSKGGRVNYMSTDPPSNHGQHQTPSTDQVTAKFINTQTQVVHKHHVGYVYDNFIELMDVRLNFVFRLNY
jgi:opacity protein-like surface antigen